MQPRGDGTGLAPDDACWVAAIEGVLAGVRPFALVAQPIVELQDGVIAGYEMLSRFPDDPVHGPQDWYLAAARVGLGGALNAHAVRAALARRDDLPPNTFLSMNVAPDTLCDPKVSAALDEPADLAGVVLELTEHVPLGGSIAVLDAIGGLRARGAMLAVDDTGAGYANLQALLLLRPDLVKIDRDLVAGCGTDPVRRAVVQALGEVAGRLDAWAVAEGIEHEADLRALTTIGVALGQGWLVGPPAVGWTGLPQNVRRLMGGDASRGDDPSSLRGLMLPPVLVDGDAPSSPGVVCARGGRPRAVVVRSPHGLASVPVMTISPDTSAVDAVQRALSRPPAYRFAPVVCTDERGRAVGTVGLEDLVTYLHARVRAQELTVAPPEANVPSQDLATRGRPGRSPTKETG